MEEMDEDWTEFDMNNRWIKGRRKTLILNLLFIKQQMCIFKQSKYFCIYRYLYTFSFQFKNM